MKRPLANLSIPLHRSHRFSETALHTLCWFPRSSLAALRPIPRDISQINFSILLVIVKPELFGPNVIVALPNI
ncbi:hypothetical protein BD310DRAFT_942004 [Dichomitus squalens]|uniref:Uncharacterized protein n=1 Tax=Dichomitus squalens TaxID=114155 RepID=A0A4Q9PEY7_9APHY|nr:hypothetical protein BD310DRAFT_942004 [Dichomitus squalens]